MFADPCSRLIYKRNSRYLRDYATTLLETRPEKKGLLIGEISSALINRSEQAFLAAAGTIRHDADLVQTTDSGIKWLAKLFTWSWKEKFT